MTLPNKEHSFFNKNDVKIMQFKDFEEIFLDSFSAKYSTITPKEAEMARFFLDKFKEITLPETYKGYADFTKPNGYTTGFVARSQDYQNLAIGLEASIRDIFYIPYAIKSVKLCFGQIPLNATNPIETIQKLIAKEKFEDKKVSKSLSQWSSFSGDGLDYDVSLVYECHEKFASIPPHEPIIDENKIIVSFGKNNGGNYSLNHLDQSWRINPPVFDFEKITDKIYTEICDYDRKQYL